MLREINRLGLFFEDCYREVSVREYSREVGISPPTSSKLLKSFKKEGLLVSREDRGNLLFRANQDSLFLKDLSRIYWSQKLKEFIEYLDSFSPKSIILFGSLSKLEARKDSDIDILFFGRKRELSLDKLEKKLKRKIQVLFYDSLGKVNEDLKLNIINGYILRGYLL